MSHIEQIETTISDRNAWSARRRLGIPNNKKLLVVACMDERLPVEEVLGLEFFRHEGNDLWLRGIQGQVSAHWSELLVQLQSSEVDVDVAIEFNLYGRTTGSTRKPDGLDTVYFAHGFSGHGVSTANFAGVVLAEAITGTASRFDAFADLPIHTFPGGTLLRYPGMVLGMLFYSLKDRF